MLSTANGDVGIPDLIHLSACIDEQIALSPSDPVAKAQKVGRSNDRLPVHAMPSGMKPWAMKKTLRRPLVKVLHMSVVKEVECWEHDPASRLNQWQEPRNILELPIVGRIHKGLEASTIG